MKKAKFDFGEGGIQGFCIRHVEKFVLGVVAILLVGFIYMGMQAPALDAGKSPDNLESAVKNAESTLVRTKWDDVKVAKTKDVSFDTETKVLSVQRPVEPSGYPFVQILNRPETPRLDPRTDPKIFAPVAIRVTPYHGALHTRDGDDPQGGLDSVTAVGGGRSRKATGTYKPDTPDGGYKSTHLMVITAAVPYGKQNKEYVRAFANSPDYQMVDRDDVQYLWAILQRAEVQSDADFPKESDWKTINKSLDWKKYRAIVGESTQEASLDPVSEESPNAITQPVPPILAADLTAALKHPDIPLRKPVDLNKVGLPAMPDDEEGVNDDVPMDTDAMPEDASESPPTDGPPAGDDVPDSASILDKAIAEGYTVTARQLPNTRQAGKKPKPAKPGKPGKPGMGSMPMMPGMGGGPPTGSMGGSSGMPMMPGMPTGSMGGSSGPPNMNSMMQMMGKMPGGGMGNAGMPNILGMPGGAFNQQRQVVPWKLLRLVDASVEPGKKYKYRVRISVHDPNRPRDPANTPESSFLAVEVKERLRGLDAADAKSKRRTYYRYSDYSEASSAVSLPPSTTVLAGGTSGQSSASVVSEMRELECPVGDQSLKVLAVSWDNKLATHVPGETIVTHGSVMYFNKKALTKDEANKERPLHVLNPLAGDLRVVKEYDWKSATQVLDIHGGISLKGVSRGGGVPTPKSASEALLMDESGNLVVIDELASFEGYGEFTYAAEAGADPAMPMMDFGEPPGGSGYGPPPSGFGIAPPTGAPGKAKPARNR